MIKVDSLPVHQISERRFIMGFSLNQAVKPQTIELNKNASVFASNESSKKRPYVEGEKPNFSKADVLYLLKNIGEIYTLPLSMNKTVKLIKKDKKDRTTIISRETFEMLEQLLLTLGVDDFGFFEVTPDKIFKDCGVPHRFALVFSSGMSYEAFKNAPSIECQTEVAKVYSRTGLIANEVAAFLQSKGFGASPNHSMGGQLDYSMAVEWAGIGITGKHSMAITPKNGPCHRISVVYTDIKNLDDFIFKNNDDLLWVKAFCEKCGKCQRTCPTGAILNEPTIIDGYNPTRIKYQNCADGFTQYGCGICIKSCPFSTGNYEVIKKAFNRTRIE